MQGVCFRKRTFPVSVNQALDKFSDEADNCDKYEHPPFPKD
jgi:hypothetical protein